MSETEGTAAQAQQVNSRRRLLNATAVMTSGTMISRFLGLIRNVLIVVALGNGTLRSEVFYNALTVPNSLYILVIGGTLSNVLVPQIVRAVTHDSDGGKAFVDRIMTAFILLLAVVTVVLTVITPLVMSIYTADSWREPQMLGQWQALLMMSFITMPQIFFYGVFFLIGQVLNARDRFGPMMWAPIANNVVAIAVLGAYLAVWGSDSDPGAVFTTEQCVALGAGSTLGIVVQTLILVPYLKKVGFSYRPRFDLRHTGLGQTFHVAKWMVGYIALISLAQIVVQNQASTALPGTIDAITGEASRGAGWGAYQNAYLVWILPHSLITVSLATAMLPSASRSWVKGDAAGVAAETTRAIRLATTFVVPACVAFLVLFDPITALAFSWGSGAADYHFVGWALLCFGIGLVPYTLQYLYLRAFYAMDNTKTPFLLQIAISGANAVLAVGLVWMLADPGTVAARLALAYSLAYILGLIITHRALRKRLPEFDTGKLVQHLVRLLVASIPAVALAWGVIWAFTQLGGRIWPAIGLLVAVAVAVVVFFFTARRMHIAEANDLINVLRRRPMVSEEVAEAEVAEEVEGIDAPLPGDDTLSSSRGREAEPGINTLPAESEETPSEPLAYPDPDTHPINRVKAYPQADQVLGNRYRLDLHLSRKGTTQTWRAYDEILARYVVVNLLAPGDPRADKVLEVAQQSATATDARVLRVLDIVPEAPGEHGAYLVSEYVIAQTLASMLAKGPLSGQETAWVVREAADALVSCHAAGLYHRHLNPATVLITANGNVKISGMLVDEALNEIPTVGDDEAADVRALGKLIFACLTAHWPDGPRFGLPGAQRAKLPSEVCQVPAAVESVADRILSIVPRRFAAPLRTAQDVVAALTEVLGPVSSAQDLRARLVLPALVAPPPPPPAADDKPDDKATDESPEIPGPPAPPDSAEAVPFVQQAMDEADVFTPVPPPPAPKKEKERKPGRKTWLSVLVVVWALSNLVVAGALLSEPVPSPTPTPTAAATPTPSPSPTLAKVKITAAEDFDPKADGGSGGENGDQVKRAYDGKADTAWLTERYRSKATYGGLKPGTGLILEFKEAVAIAEVRLTLVGEPSNVELRIPKDQKKVSTDTVKDWKVIASKDKAGEKLTLKPKDEVKTNTLLVYLTSLPKDGSRYRGGIAEVAAYTLK
jgi:murein biosynthesis integral membrane protein MurJ